MSRSGRGGTLAVANTKGSVDELSAGGCHSTEPNHQPRGTVRRLCYVLRDYAFGHDQLDAAGKDKLTTNDGAFDVRGGTYKEHTVLFDGPVFRLEKLRFRRIRSYYSQNYEFRHAKSSSEMRSVDPTFSSGSSTHS